MSTTIEIKAPLRRYGNIVINKVADELSKFHAWEDARVLVAKAREACK